jgi:hypothetical protein
MDSPFESVLLKLPIKKLLRLTAIIEETYPNRRQQPVSQLREQGKSERAVSQEG